MAPQDRFRAFARRRVDAPVTVRTTEDRADRQASLVDLGLGGACLELGDALVPGLGLTVEVRTPMLWDPLRLQGQIAWARWNAQTGIARVGVRFDHENAASLYSLFELLCSQEFDE